MYDMNWYDMNRHLYMNRYKGIGKNASKVRKMLGCSNKRYQNFDFIRRRLYNMNR